MASNLFNEYDLIEDIVRYLKEKLDGFECGLTNKRSQRLLEEEAQSTVNGKVFIAFMGNPKPEKLGGARAWNWYSEILFTLMVKGIDNERDFIERKNEIISNMITYGYKNFLLDIGESGTAVYTEDGSNLAIGELVFIYPSYLYT